MCYTRHWLVNANETHSHLGTLAGARVPAPRARVNLPLHLFSCYNSFLNREKTIKLASVKQIYRALNRKNFGGVLVEPIILFSRTRKLHAFYDRIMAFNLAETKGWFAVRELVFHEMCHQYIDEFLQAKDDDDHGRVFKKTYSKFATQNMNFDQEMKL